MTTPDPSREAFDKWAQTHYRNFEDYGIRDYLMGITAWQTAVASMQAELEQAHEARRQAQSELSDMQEKSNRIGRDIDRALRGDVNEQSPIAGRLKLIAEAEAPKQEGRGAAPTSPESAQTRIDAGSAVLPNQAYRMLIPDVDIIRSDDEYLSDDTTTWEPVGRGIFVGMPHLRAFKPGRRKQEGST